MAGRVPLKGANCKDDIEMLRASDSFLQSIRSRRSIRDFSSKPVPRKVIENCILAAGSAPSGANLQPWHFSVVSSLETKQKIRLAAEQEEREFYQHRRRRNGSRIWRRWEPMTKSRFWRLHLI